MNSDILRDTPTNQIRGNELRYTYLIFSYLLQLKGYHRVIEYRLQKTYTSSKIFCRSLVNLMDHREEAV